LYFGVLERKAGSTERNGGQLERNCGSTGLNGRCLERKAAMFERTCNKYKNTYRKNRHNTELWCRTKPDWHACNRTFSHNNFLYKQIEKKGRKYDTTKYFLLFTYEG
jgi:hypothetical protein